MSIRFSHESVQLAILAYPLFSNIEIAEHIGCSVAWLQKLGEKNNLFKADYCFAPKQSGYPFDLTGYRFGKLTVTARMEHKEKNNTMWKCVCECSKEIRCRSAILRKGNKLDCGCCSKSKVERRRKNGEMGSWVWSKIKSHANDRGIAVEIDCEYVISLFYKQKGLCALSDIPLSFPKIVNNKKEGNASLDRIDSNLPYREGNVQWIHKDINIMKNNLEENYFKELCKQVVQRETRRTLV